MQRPQTQSFEDFAPLQELNSKVSGRGGSEHCTARKTMVGEGVTKKSLILLRGQFYQDSSAKMVFERPFLFIRYCQSHHS